VRAEIYHVRIPTRGFEHAASSRDVAESVVVRLELPDGRCGWGETHPRRYVTGETIETVVSDLREFVFPRYCEDPVSLLPERRDGRIINAATCALDLAHLDATAAFGELASRQPRIPARVSGVLGSSDPRRTRRALRLMRCFALRDFKLKLGFGEQRDDENLQVVSSVLAEGISKGRCTLRVDVNGAWEADSVPKRVAELKPYGVCAVEQPVFCDARQFAELSRRCELPLISDESLLTEDDGRLLSADPRRLWWNIRISKNGGLRRAARLTEIARSNAVPFVIGCMVGESGILSAAQRRLLQVCPEARYVEGNYGKYLLKGDLTRRSMRLGYAGKLNPLKGDRLGITVMGGALRRYGKLLLTLEAPRIR